MSIEEQDLYYSYIGNGVTAQFPFNCRIFEAADLSVTVAGAVKALGVDYYITGVDATGGGDVNFVAGSIPTSGSRVELERVLDYSRPTGYVQHGDFRPEVVDKDQDYQTALIQQIKNSTPRLPSVSQRAGKVYGFDALGNVALYDPDTPYLLNLGVAVGNYDSLNSAVAALGTDDSTLVVNEPCITTSDLHIPGNVSIIISKGGKISNDYALSTDGPVNNSGLGACFFGNGTVLFGVGSVSEVSSTWFGNDADAIQKALNAVSMVSSAAELSDQFGATVRIPSGRFLVSKTIIIPTNVNLIGEGIASTVLQASGLASGQAVVRFKNAVSGQTHSKLTHISISGNNIAGIVGIDMWDGTGPNSQNNFSHVDSCYIARCAIGVRADSGAAGKYIIYSKITNCVFGETTLNGWKHIQLANGVNYLHIKNNCFFQSNNTGWSIYSETSFFGDYIDIDGNSFDTGNGSDASAIYLNGIPGDYGVGAVIHNNRFEGGGVFVNSTYMTVIISLNWIICGARCVYTKGINNRIIDNIFHMRSADAASNYDAAIVVASGAVGTYIGHNGYGAFGESHYCCTRVSDSGADTLLFHEFHGSPGSAGTHEKGDVVRTVPATDGRSVERVCVTAGTVNSSASATTGTVTAGDEYHITIVNPVGYVKGSYIDIAGVGTRKIKHIANGIARLTTVASAVSGAAVTLTVPVYKSIGNANAKGTTAQRPTPYTTELALIYLDTTLDPDGLPIFWTGSKWVKSDGTDA